MIIISTATNCNFANWLQVGKLTAGADEPLRNNDSALENREWGWTVAQNNDLQAELLKKKFSAFFAMLVHIQATFLEARRSLASSW